MPEDLRGLAVAAASVLAVIQFINWRRTWSVPDSRYYFAMGLVLAALAMGLALFGGAA
jgi:hypothetical protein